MRKNMFIIEATTGGVDIFSFCKMCMWCVGDYVCSNLANVKICVCVCVCVCVCMYRF